MHTRRHFGKLLLAGVPASVALAYIDSTVKGVSLGVCTYSFRDFPRTPGSDNIDAIIRALKDTGAGVTELFSANVEPAPSVAGPQRRNSPEAAKAREELRQWRLTTPMDHFAGIRKKFDAAGIDLFAYTMNYNAGFTDDEIAKTFEQAKALRARTIATSTQVGMLPRLLPMAEKYKMNVSLHGHSKVRDPNEFATPETFQKAIAMSHYFQINLDIGHFTAANFDPVAFIQEQHARITHLHIKDRKKDDGANAPFGEGDTPIKPVLTLLRDKKYAIPALVEYEYKGGGTSVEEVKKCMQYMRQCLS